MKKHIYKYLLVILSISTSLFVGCDDDDGYDFDAIVPIVQDFSGPSEAFASGAGFVTYSVTGRGGSTFEYSVTGIEATIVKSDDETSAQITFAQSDVNVEAVVSVVETTYGGVESTPAVINVSLNKFKPMAFEDFLGDWIGTGYDGYSLDFEAVAGLGENELILKAVGGIPALYPAIFIGWEETFQAGFGNDGDIVVQLDLETGGISMAEQYWGQTLPGPYDYWFSGDGLWDGFNQTMTINYGMLFEPGGDPYKHMEGIILSKK